MAITRVAMNTDDDDDVRKIEENSINLFNNPKT